MNDNKKEEIMDNNECDALFKRAKEAYEQEKGKRRVKGKEVFEEKILPVFENATLLNYGKNYLEVSICGHKFHAVFTFSDYKGLASDFSCHQSFGDPPLINTLADFGEYLLLFEEYMKNMEERYEAAQIKTEKESYWKKFVNLFK